MNSLVELSVQDLAIASALLVLLGLLNLTIQRSLASDLWIAGLRMLVQLSIIGLVIRWVFDRAELSWVLTAGFLMIIIAGREIVARQQYRISVKLNWLIASSSIFISSVTTLLFCLTVIVQYEPWWQPQYFIPLLGMLLGNTLNTIALSMDRISAALVEQRDLVENRLALGDDWKLASATMRKSALHAAMTPVINMLAAAGLVSLPGMMTGQILAGADPMTAVKYQILILILIAVAGGFGAYLATWWSNRVMFDARDRLIKVDARRPHY